jgi:EpsI family protein
MSSYVMRVYQGPQEAAGDLGLASLYVGYYESQTRGKTIHSPKNCLPGSGWEALTSRAVPIAVAGGSLVVNRYLLQRGEDRALVLYWYQGRGRVEANEYRVKWDLLRDAALHRRSDEALVRIIVPLTGSEEEAFELAVRMAGEILPRVDDALPVWASG